MAEQTFLNEGGITVTNSRFIAGGQTYAMSGVTSVKATKNIPSKKGPIILIVLGLLGLMMPESAKLFGLLLLGGGIAWLVLNKPTFSVVLSSASGEAEAYTSKDENFIANVVNALNEAIIARG
ncbi:MAG: hypothetical protein KDH97_14865 [Calditrichaeota bacterium]|nr:hypothetical protein [Calditrichota bacterium]MCB0291534.1 hypothetical protein [Calditrichota bacterium]